MRQTAVALAEDNSEIDITPMLDVVFIMLIFFVVTASFVKEDGLLLAQPDPAIIPPDSRPQNVVIDIHGEGRILINGRSVDIRAATPNISRLRAENPEAKVIIRPVGEARNGDIAAVMNASREAGVADVSFAMPIDE